MKKRIFQLLSNRVYFLLILLLIVMVVMSLISPYFLNIDNLITMARFGAVLALVGLGQSLIILAGGAGIDLSVGSMISLAGVLFGFMVTAGLNVWLSAVFAILIGGILGSVNGLTIAIWGLPPLIGTLGTMYAYSALALVMTNGVPISGYPDSFSFLANGKVLGLPTQIILVIIPVFLMLLFTVRRTNFGRWIYLVGVNENSAQFSGIQVKRVRFILYVISGLLAGMGAVIMSSWLMASRPDAGSGMDMRSITVAVLGGTDIYGGVGNITGTILAVLIVTMIASGLQLANINTIWQLAVLGVILLGAVSLNQVFVSKTN